MQVKDLVSTAATAEDKIGGQYQKHVEETPENQVNQRIEIQYYNYNVLVTVCTMQVKDLVALTISTSLNEIMEEADTQALSIDIH